MTEPSLTNKRDVAWLKREISSFLLLLCEQPTETERKRIEPYLYAAVDDAVRQERWSAYHMGYEDAEDEHECDCDEEREDAENAGYDVGYAEGCRDDEAARQLGYDHGYDVGYTAGRLDKLLLDD